MKNYTRSFSEVHNEIIRHINNNSEQPRLPDFDLMSANLWRNNYEMNSYPHTGGENKEKREIPDYNTMVSDLLQNEADFGIYPQVGKYSKIFRYVKNHTNKSFNLINKH